MIFHIDANAFYASCETLFRPDLADKPVIVLTNNDAVIISLNEKAKAAGLKRGDRYREIAHRCNAIVFSSNYTLYADISRRITSLYFDYTPEVEQYSIDECFLVFPDYDRRTCTELAVSIKETVYRHTGIPVSVGCAPTKTLAKWCNSIAKKPDAHGICCYDKTTADTLLAATPVDRIWGIGRQKSETLRSYGIRNAFQLKYYPSALAKKHLSLTGWNTVRELNGIPSAGENSRCSRYAISVSRQFGSKVHNREELEEAVREYSALAVEKLLRLHQKAGAVAVYITTSPYAGVHDAQDIRYAASAEQRFPLPVSYLPEITRAALQILHTLFRPGYAYRKVLVALTNLQDNNCQLDLFTDNAGRHTATQLMSAYASLTERYGRGILTLGAPAYREHWQMKREHLSPCYTTNLRDIPVLR